MKLIPNQNFKILKIPAISNYAALVLTALFIFFSSMTVFAQGFDPAAEKEDRNFILQLFGDKHYEFAYEEAQNYLNLYPTSDFRSGALFIMAQIHGIQGRPSKALEQYQFLLKNYPKSSHLEDIFFQAGAQNLRQSHFEKGNKLFQKLLQEFPQTKYQSKISFLLGRAEFDRKEFQRAEIHLKNFLKSKNSSGKEQLEARYYRAWSMYFLNKKKLAEIEFTQLLKTALEADQKAQISFQLGVIAFEEKDYKNAVKIFSGLKQKWPEVNFKNKELFYPAESLYQWYQLDKTILKQKDLEFATQLFSQNLKSTHPFEPVISRYHKGWLELALEHPQKAVDDFSILQKNNPDFKQDMTLTKIRADYYKKNQDFQSLITLYETAYRIQKDPSNKNTLLMNLIKTHFQQGDCDKVLLNSEGIGSENLAKNKDEFLFYLGTCHFKKENWNLASKALTQVSFDSIYGPKVIEPAIITYQRLEDLSGGIAYIDKILLTKNADQEKLLLIQTEFYLDLKQWRPARDNLNHIMAQQPEKQKDPQFLILLAGVYNHLNDSIKAVETYETTYKLLPVNSKKTKLEILTYLTANYKKSEDYKKLIEAYQEQIKLEDEESQQDEFKLEIAKLQTSKLDQRSEAAKILAALHEKNQKGETYRSASELLAELQIEAKNFKEAIKILEDLITRLPESSNKSGEVHFRLAQLYQSFEDWKPALNHYQKAAKQSQDPSIKKQAKDQYKQISDYLKQIK